MTQFVVRFMLLNLLFSVHWLWTIVCLVDFSILAIVLSVEWFHHCTKRGRFWVHKISLTLSSFIEVSVSSLENVRSYICVRSIDLCLCFSVLSIGCWNCADCVLFFFSFPGFTVCDYPLVILGITKHVLNINNLYELKIFISRKMFLLVDFIRVYKFGANLNFNLTTRANYVIWLAYDQSWIIKKKTTKWLKILYPVNDL